MHKDARLTSRRHSRRDFDLKLSHLQIECDPWQVGQVDGAWDVINACPCGACSR